MTRFDFFKSIISGATAVKAVGETMPDSSAPKTKRLLAIEVPGLLTGQEVVNMKTYLADCERRYGIEFIILDRGARLVDPTAARQPSLRQSDMPGEVTDLTVHAPGGWRQFPTFKK